MKKFNLPLNYGDLTPNAAPEEYLINDSGCIYEVEAWFQDEDVLRELDPKWNEPQRQKINGGIFNSKGEYNLDWDIRGDKGHAKFKERSNKIYGLLEKGVGKKFDDVYSKLCRSGLADKPLWWRTVREDFLSKFKDGQYSGGYYIDDEGLIQRRKTQRRTRVPHDIRILYETPIITYKVNHSNLESVADAFITEFGTDTYYHLLFTDEIQESKYLKYMDKWRKESCRKVMEASRRSREWKSRYYTLDRIENIFRFIFDKRYEYYKKVIKYGTREYIEYKRNHKRTRKGRNYLTPDQRTYYDAVMRWEKKFGNYSPVDFAIKYNHEFCGNKLPLTPDERRELKGKPRWDS